MELNQKAARRKLVGRIARMIVLVVCAALFLVPIIFSFFISLKTKTEIFTDPFSWPSPVQWVNYANAWEIMEFPKLFLNTIIVSALSISVGLFMVLLSSFAIARMKFGSGKLQNGVYAFFIAGIILPSFVLLLPIYMMNSELGTLNTYWGVLLPYWGWTAPMHTLIMVAAFRSIPSTLDEAATIDGCGAMGILFRINVPVIKPALVTSFIICFLGIWNEFPLSSVVLTSSDVQTVALGASKFKGLFTVDYALMAAGVMILTIPQIIFFSFFQRYIVAGMAVGSVKG